MIKAPTWRKTTGTEQDYSPLSTSNSWLTAPALF
jgi:hypothetical protein